MNMTSSYPHTRIAWQLALSLIVATLCSDSSCVIGQVLPTTIESELPLTVESREAGKLNLFLASTDDYILDVTFLCTFSTELTVYDPFGEDVLHAAWRTAVFQQGQFIGYLKQPASQRECQRLPTKLKRGFIVGAACDIKTGPRTLLETSAVGPIIQVLGHGKYALQTTLLQNFLAEKTSDESEVIARSAAFPLEIDETLNEPRVAANPEGRAELSIADYLPGRVKNDLYFYYVNTTSDT
ncbi:MAG: hypothetical protein ABI557_12935, partial [Aureliella sp.]